MPHHDHQKTLSALWKKAVDQYAAGGRDSSSFFDSEESAALSVFGITAQEVFDYAEDFHGGGEPDEATFLLVHEIRLDYFLRVQRSVPSPFRLQADLLPPKDAVVAGVPWLPRILPKARAKIRGELCHEIMYGCGGDRRFFRENDIHPAEFLRVVLDAGVDDSKVIDWVLARREEKV